MTEIVTSLPVLDQSKFPALPDLPEDAAMLLIFGTKLRRYEPEAVLAVLATAAIRAKNWHAVSVQEYFAIAQKGVPAPMLRGVVNATWDLVKQGLVQIVQHDEVQYVVPSPEFAANLNGGGLRYIPAA